VTDEEIAAAIREAHKEGWREGKDGESIPMVVFGVFSYIAGFISGCFGH